MSLHHVSLTVRSGTSQLDIAAFLDEAGREVHNAASGLRARHAVEHIDDRDEAAVVLYVRTDRNPKTIGDRVLLWLDDIHAYFTAKAEYRLAARTLLERANRSSHVEDGTGLCTGINQVLNETRRCLTPEMAQEAWWHAFPSQAPSTDMKFSELSKQMPKRRKNNGQEPPQLIARGKKDLPYMRAMLDAPFGRLGMTQKVHLVAFEKFLGTVDVNDLRKGFDGLITVLDMLNDSQSSSTPLPGGEEARQAPIENAIAFSKRWLDRWKSQPEKHANLRYAHIAAIDFLTGNILRAFAPAGVRLVSVNALLKSVGEPNTGCMYNSISTFLDPNFKKWIDEGKPVHLYYAEHELTAR